MPLVRTLRLKSGPAAGAAPSSLDVGTVTVFVGANNSGKSLVLREITAAFQGNLGEQRIVANVELAIATETDLRGLLQPREVSSSVDNGREFKTISLIDLGGGQAGDGPHTINLTGHLGELASGQQQMLRREIISHFALWLDGRTRLALVSDRPLGDLQQPPKNVLQTLFRDDVLRARLRGLVHGVFGQFLVVDPTSAGNLRLRVSKTEPSAEVERGLTEGSIAFHREATPLSSMSDGVQSFVGIALALYASGARAFQIDEPEAFLHPPLARRLGRVIAEEARRTDSNAFVATHSSDFLMGAIESGTHVDVIRLTYVRDVATARLLPATDLNELMGDPLLRSTDVLDALFHAGAIVTEADSDRAFYQEVNVRLLSDGLQAADDTLFLNATGKGTVRRIVGALRKMGIPAAALVDLDMIRKPGEFRALLAGC